MDSEPREEVIESSEEETDSFDNYGVFQSDYEFKFVQEGNDKTTLMLPPVTYDSMDVKYFNIEIEVDSELHVSALEKEETDNGTTRYFFRIAKHRILAKTEEGESVEPLGEDGYEYEEMVDAVSKEEKGKARKTRTPMDAHNYSKPKAISTTCHDNDQRESETPGEKKRPTETVKVKVEALDGTQIDQDSSSVVEYADTEDLDAEDIDDDGDDDMDDFEEIELAGNMSLVEEEQNSDSLVTAKRRGQKRKMGTTSEKKRKYTRTNHYSKDSSNFTVELTDEGRLFLCKICSYRSKWPGNMRDHVRLHTGERPFKCKICGKSFSNQASHTKHMPVHSDERPHICDICGFSFKLKPQLVKHYRRHLTPGSLKCTFCGKSYYTNSELKHHLPTHTGERNFKCEDCDKSFSSASSLVRHKMVHAGGKYNCHICGHVSTRKEYWRTHMIKEHNYDENDKLLAKKKCFGRLYEQSKAEMEPNVHAITIVKTEPVETESGSNAAYQELEVKLDI